MQTTTKRTTVDIDTRRTIVMTARARKPADVAKVPHEAFVRQTLKARMGWAKNEPAPDHIKAVAREIAAQLEAGGKAVADARFEAKQAEAKRITDMEADTAAM